MSEPKILLERLQKSLHILEQRRAKYGIDASASLILEVEDHKKAITLTEQLASGHLTETAWREQLQPLLVTIEERQATETVTSLNIGGVSFSQISGSHITTGDIDASIHTSGDVVAGDKVSQTAEGNNIAQASHGGQATVNVTDQRGQQIETQYIGGRDVNISQMEEETPFWKRLSRVQLVIGGIIIPLIGIVLATLAVPQFNAWFFPDPTPTITPTTNPTSTPSPTPLAFATATHDEILILVATFYETTANNVEPHTEIHDRIQKDAQDIVRVEIEPTVLRADEREAAEVLGNLYNADIVIWGEDKSIKVTVNFLNLSQPDFTVAEARIDETERTVIVNPEAYSQFILSDLPNQLTFLTFFTVGQSYYIDKNYKQAKDIIEKGLANLPESNLEIEGLGEAYYRLGWLYLNDENLLEEDIDKAVDNFNWAIELDPEPSWAYYDRGNAYLLKGNYDQALDDYTQSINLKPDYAWAYYKLGETYIKQSEYVKDLPKLKRDKYVKALSELNKAIELDPQHLWAFYLRGTVHTELGQLDQALHDFNKADELEPKYFWNYYMRGDTYYKLGNFDKALEDLNQAINLDSEEAWGYHLRGLIYLQKGEIDAAFTDFNKAIAIADPLEAAFYSGRGDTYLHQENFTAAISDYTRSIELDQQVPDVYFNRGKAYRNQGDLEAAATDFEQGLTLKPQAENADWTQHELENIRDQLAEQSN